MWRCQKKREREREKQTTAENRLVFNLFCQDIRSQIYPLLLETGKQQPSHRKVLSIKFYWLSSLAEWAGVREKFFGTRKIDWIKSCIHFNRQKTSLLFGTPADRLQFSIDLFGFFMNKPSQNNYWLRSINSLFFFLLSAGAVGWYCRSCLPFFFKLKRKESFVKINHFSPMKKKSAEFIEHQQKVYGSTNGLGDWLSASHPNRSPSTPDNANIVFRFYLLAIYPLNSSTLTHARREREKLTHHRALTICLIATSRFLQQMLSVSLYFLPIKHTINLPLINAIIFNDFITDIWRFFSRFPHRFSFIHCWPHCWMHATDANVSTTKINDLRKQLKKDRENRKVAK